MDIRTQKQAITHSSLNTQASIVVDSQSRNDDAKKYKKIYFRLGLVHLVIGITCIAFGITLVCLDKSSYYATVVPGIWCGVLFLLPGILGMIAGRNVRLCIIISSLVTTVLAALASIPLLGIEVVASIESYYFPSYWDRYTLHYVRYKKDYEDDPVFHPGFSMHITLCCLAFIELVVSIVHCVYCSLAICCKQVAPVICVTCPTQLNQLQRTTIRETGQLVTHVQPNQPTYVRFEPGNSPSFNIPATQTPPNRGSHSPPPSYEENNLNE